MLIYDIESDHLNPKKVKVVHSVVYYDTETDQLVSGVPAGKQYESPNDARVVFLGDAVGDLELAKEKGGHNVYKYDDKVLHHKGYNGFKSSFDTLVASRLVFPDIKENHFRYNKKVDEARRLPNKLIGSHGLEAWGYVLGSHKGAFGKATDWSEWSPEMQSYCEQDVLLNVRLYRFLLGKNCSEQSHELEQIFQRAVLDLEDTGWAFDKPGCEKLVDKLTEMKQGPEGRLRDALGKYDKTETLKTPEYYSLYLAASNETIYGDRKGDIKAQLSARGLPLKLYDGIEEGPKRVRVTKVNPTSEQQLGAILMSDYGWEPEEFIPTGQPKLSVKSLEHMDSDAIPWLPDAILMMKIKKRLSQLSTGSSAWLKVAKAVDSDAWRIFGKMKTNGTVTGRCSHYNPNISQVPSTKNRFGEDQFMGAECRSLFVAPYGYNIVGGDAGSIELCMLAHYMYPWDNGEFTNIVNNPDIKMHKLNQRILGLENHKGGYGIAKTFIYAYLYGAFDLKLGQTLEPQEGDKKKLERIGAEGRSKIEESYKALKYLKDSLRKSAGFVQTKKGRWVKSKTGSGMITGLDGRKLPVRSEHSLLNTLLQCAGSIYMKQALVDLWKAAKNRWPDYGYNGDWCLCSMSHDEVQSQVRKEITDDYARLVEESIVNAGTAFGVRCPVSADVKVGSSWLDTH